jgi:16S rRNA (uracil1498-N3)-methyltransferase
MSVRVFHGPGDSLQPGARIELDREESHYLLRVRRARAGDAIEVLDGVGGRWHARVQPPPTSGSGPASVVLDAAVALPAPAREVVLLLALPDPKATLEALAAACAGGASAVVFVGTEHAHASLPGSDRIDRIMRATMRQCGRPAPPGLRGPIPLARALEERAELPGVVAEPGADGGDLHPGHGVRFLVGPEGGLSSDELRRSRAAGFSPLSLGPWTLRTETAVTAGLARLVTA